MHPGDGWAGVWRVAFYLDVHTNPLKVAISKLENDGPRTITEIHPGPFDPAEEILSLCLEMIEHLGYQQQLTGGDLTT